MTERELLEVLVNEVKEIKTDINLMKTQQVEHSEILHSVRHAQEAQKAQTDALQLEVAHLSGKMEQGFSDVVEVQKSVLEMYGAHEAEIRTLRRKPV